MTETIQTKCCSKCQEIKSLAEFHRDHYAPDGLTHQCKICRKTYRQSTRGKIAQKQYQQSVKGKAAYKRYDSKVHRQFLHKKYQQTLKGKATQTRFRTKYPNKVMSHRTVNLAVKAGRLPAVKTLKCVHCNNMAEFWHHYLGYESEHWLDVIPLCRLCDRKAHWGLIQSIPTRVPVD